MASEQTIVDDIVLQMSAGGDVRSRKMFGEYAVYCNDKVVALVCDNQLFVKITPGSTKLLPHAQTSPPYPGAKDSYVVARELWQDAALMGELAAAIADDLPAPKPKRR